MFFSAIFDIGVVALRILLPVYAIIIVYQCYAAMRRRRRPETPLVTLVNPQTGLKLPVLFWENSIGRSRSSDIVVDDPTVSRSHCVLLRRSDGWFITDTGSKSGTYVNGEKIEERTQLLIDDVIGVGNSEFEFKRGEEYHERLDSSWFFRKVNNKPAIKSWKLMLALALFLTGTGVMLLVRQVERSAYVQLIAAAVGMILFCVIIKFIQNPDKVNKLRFPMMIVAVGLLLTSVIFGKTTGGAANWIYIGSISIQPSELVKVIYIFIGSSALDKLQTKKNLLEFIVFSIVCVGLLALMGDFGTALIFFMTFLLIAFMRSGDFKTIILAVAAAVFGATIILRFKPYVANRFKAWRHVWDYAQDQGYQQVHVLTFIASGGLFGVGIGNGFLKQVAASESDLVFGLVSEEMGIIVAITLALAVALLVVYARAITTRSRSTFYSISACCAAGLLVVQLALNIFGATDILPLTGVTFPFISSGGSSIISCWGLLAFVKAADERTYSMKR